MGQATHQLQLTPYDGTVGDIEFLDADGSAGVRLKAPATVASDFDLTLPDALPGSTLCITVDTSGNMDYASCSGGGTTLPVVDTTSLVEGSVDATKEVRIEADGITPGTVRVWTAPDANLTVAGINLSQTYTGQPIFDGGIVMGGDFFVDTDSAYDLATISSRIRTGFMDTLDVDILALSNDAHSNQWTIQRRSGAEDYIDFAGTSGIVAFSVVNTGGIAGAVLPESFDMSWMDSGTVIPSITSSNGNLTLGPQDPPAANNTTFVVNLQAQARSSGGTARDSVVRFEQIAASNESYFRPTEANTFLGSTSQPWTVAFTNGVVITDSGGVNFDFTEGINGITQSQGDTIVGAFTASATNNVSYTTSLSAASRSSGGTARDSQLLFEQQTDGNIVFRPTEALTFLGTASDPWAGFWSDAAVIGNLTVGNLTAATSVSCTGKADGTIYGTDDLYIAMCIGGARYRVLLASY